MTEKLAKVTFEDAAERMRDQIRSAFVEMLTPDQWRDMVRKELESFFQPRDVREYGSYGSWKTLPPLFNEVVADVFTKEVEKRAREIITDGHWRPEEGSFWCHGHFDCLVSSSIRAWLTDNAATLLDITLQRLIGKGAEDVLRALDPNRPNQY